MHINLWIKAGIREQKAVVQNLGYSVKTVRRFCKENLNLSPENIRILEMQNILDRNICWKNESEFQKIKLEILGFLTRYKCTNGNGFRYAYLENNCTHCPKSKICFVGGKTFVNFPHEYSLELVFKNYINSKVIDEFLL